MEVAGAMIHITDDAELIPPWASALSMYDPATAAHSARVGRAARKLGKAAGLNDDDVTLVGLAGILHDIGKLAVPLAVLTKPGPLTAEQWALIHRHPAAGADMIVSLTGWASPVADAVRSHHERWDGSGYPSDAITHPRCYRGTVFTRDEALAKIVISSGSHFDPHLVRVFEATMAEGHDFTTLVDPVIFNLAAAVGAP